VQDVEATVSLDGFPGVWESVQEMLFDLSRVRFVSAGAVAAPGAADPAAAAARPATATGAGAGTGTGTAGASTAGGREEPALDDDGEGEDENLTVEHVGGNQSYFCSETSSSAGGDGGANVQPSHGRSNPLIRRRGGPGSRGFGRPTSSRGRRDGGSAANAAALAGQRPPASMSATIVPSSPLAVSVLEHIHTDAMTASAVSSCRVALIDLMRSWPISVPLLSETALSPEGLWKLLRLCHFSPHLPVREASEATSGAASQPDAAGAGGGAGGGGGGGGSGGAATAALGEALVRILAADTAGAAALSQALCAESIYQLIHGSAALSAGTDERERAVPPLTWDPETTFNNDDSISFNDGNSVAVMSRATAHRSVFGNQGFTTGVHEWVVTILAQPCCGYAGIAAHGSLGTQDSFADSKTCVGFNNFSEPRNVGRTLGTYVQIRLDLVRRRITYTSKHGEREVPLDPRFYGKRLYPAVDSDENGRYKIERVKSTGGGAEAAPVADEAAALVRSQPTLALTIVDLLLRPTSSEASSRQALRPQLFNALLHALRHSTQENKMNVLHDIAAFLGSPKRAPPTCGSTCGSCSGCTSTCTSCTSRRPRTRTGRRPFLRT